MCFFACVCACVVRACVRVRACLRVRVRERCEQARRVRRLVCEMKQRNSRTCRKVEMFEKLYKGRNAREVVQS
jgi:hypothetical protein